MIFDFLYSKKFHRISSTYKFYSFNYQKFYERSVGEIKLNFNMVVVSKKVQNLFTFGIRLNKYFDSACSMFYFEISFIN